MQLAALNTSFQVWVNVGVIAGIVIVFCFLHAMLRREAVKRDLWERGAEPLHIWWQPFATWKPFLRTTAFRVVYLDSEDCRHKALCCVHAGLMDSPFSRRVRWLKDEPSDFIDV